MPVKLMNVILEHPSLPSSDCPTLLVFSLRVPGKDFSLNASFTAHCSGSIKSIHILNRKQRMKHVEEKERKGLGPAPPWEPRVSICPSSLLAAAVTKHMGSGCPPGSPPWGSLDCRPVALGAEGELVGKYYLAVNY